MQPGAEETRRARGRMTAVRLAGAVASARRPVAVALTDRPMALGSPSRWRSPAVG
jgi:hypothetical protein